MAVIGEAVISDPDAPEVLDADESGEPLAPVEAGAEWAAIVGPDHDDVAGERIATFDELNDAEVAPVVTVVGSVDEDDDDDDDPAERLAVLAAMAGGGAPGLAAGDDDLETVAGVDGGELGDLHEVDEPVNRGMLLKFLSSVRN